MGYEEKYLEFIKECVSGWSDKNNEFAKLYSVGGIVEEAHELTEVISQPQRQYRSKIISECGDLLWYMTAYLLTIGLDDGAILSILGAKGKDHKSKILSEAILLHKETSKHIFYGKTISNIEEKTATIVRCVKFICEDMIGADIFFVMEENIKKIDMRYPQGRHTEHVVKRVDEEISKIDVDGRREDND